MALKIGIIGVGYQSEWINSALSAWMFLKTGWTDNILLGENKEKYEPAEFKICTVSALFKERYDMGDRYDNSKNDNYLNDLKKSGSIDNHIIVDKPILDFEARNYALEYLKNFDLDLIWQLDFGDEIYTAKNIKDIIAFIQKRPHVDWYKVNFKNFVGDTSHYVEGFCPPRIHWFKKNAGINRFVWDNDLIYNNSKHSNEVSFSEIPKSIAFINHYSWCGSSSFLKRKIEYQNRCLAPMGGFCSYRWDDKRNKIDFNEEYYAKFNISKPIIKKI